MRWATRAGCHVDRVEDPALGDIARIVHEADLGDERYEAPQATGLDALIRRLGLVADDPLLFERAAQLFDGLDELRRRLRAGEPLP